MENTNTETQQNPNSLEDITKIRRQLGAAALTAANFDSRHREIVDSSFDKVRKRGEKLPGKNNERRNYAYLSRLEDLIKKRGNEAEKRLWEASIKDDLLVKYENIPKSYWDSKKQELRDNGYGNIELTEDYKHELFSKERELQEESLEKWVGYLGDEHSPYPLWFKILAWDGITKMGKYDKSKGKYAVRNETTVAPYPNPDAEVLSGVFEVINRYYGNNERQFYTEDGEENIELEKVVQSGNFAKIYNAIEHDIAPIIEPPENPEDIHGEWIEYCIGEEDDLAKAARGTGWCVASPSVGRHYLKFDTAYDNENDNWDDDAEYNNSWGDNDEGEASSSKSKFILFHLNDPSTGKLSKNAVASIRLGQDGQVAEISGLKKGQGLNDSIVDTVAEKVKTLPGGEKFLDAFADKQTLIHLDHKMQRGENLTKEEVEFIYEINHPIHTLDTYNESDPRVKELKEHYDIPYALDVAKIDADILASSLSGKEAARNLDILIERNIDINKIVSKLYAIDIVHNLDMLTEHGASINTDELLAELRWTEIADNLDILTKHGANINIDELVSELTAEATIDRIDTLIKHGANIDIHELLSRVRKDSVIEYLDTFIKYNANIVSRLSPEDVVNNIDALIEHGISIDTIMSNLDSDEIADNIDTLIKHGVDTDRIIARLSNERILKKIDILNKNGANINANELVQKLDSNAIIRNLNELIAHGVSSNEILQKLSSSEIAYKLDTLMMHGANIDINELVSNLEPKDIDRHLDTLIKYNADIEKLISKLPPDTIAEHLDKLIECGANINVDMLISRLRPIDIAHNLDTLIKHGADINIDELISRLETHSIIRYIDELTEHGADINKIVSKLNSYNIIRYIDKLTENGADININKLLSEYNSDIDIVNFISKLYPFQIIDGLDTLIARGANINNLVSILDAYDIAYNLDTFIGHGADIDKLIAKLKTQQDDPEINEVLRTRGWL